MAIESRDGVARCLLDAQNGCAGCPTRYSTPILNEVCTTATSLDGTETYDPVKDPCGHCVGTVCCGTRRACAASPECVALSLCEFDCKGVDACLDNCRAVHPDGLPLRRETLACALVKCSPQCGAKVDACQDCAYRRCADVLFTCLSDATCQVLWTCMSACTNQACQEACLAQSAAGADKMGAWAECIQASCPGCR